MAVRTAIIKLVNVNSVGTIIYKDQSIRDVMLNLNSVHRVFEYESGSAPNAANDGDVSAPTIHEYLNLENADGFDIAHIDQFLIITKS